MILPYGYVLFPETPPPGVRVLKSATLIDTAGREEVVTIRWSVDGISGVMPQPTFRFKLPSDLDTRVPLALYINAVEPHAAFSLAGQLIHTTRLSDHRNSFIAFKPVLVQLPYPLLAQVQDFEVRISGVSGQGMSLQPVWIGPAQALGPIFAKRNSVRASGTHLMVGLYVLVAFASFAFWLSDVNYKSPLWFGAFCAMAGGVAWTGLASTEPILPLAVNMHVTIFLLTCAVAALSQFFFEKTQTRSVARDRLLAAYVLASAALAFVLYEDAIPLFRYAIVMDLSALVLGIYVMFVLLRAWWRLRDSLTTALAAGGVITFLLGVFTVVIAFIPSIERVENYAFLYAPLPLIFTMGWVIIRRYARTHLRTEALNRRLGKRVALRERQITEAYATLANMQQEKTVRTERDRFMRDMHDGLGSHLITSLRMAERGELTTQTMREVLSECLDEMHFAIESLKPSGNDLFVVLADYRYRIDPRMEMAGITMNWRVFPSDQVSLTSTQVVQVLRILNEAIGNAIKHARCTQIAIEGAPYGAQYRLSVSDSGGVGFDTARFASANVTTAGIGVVGAVGARAGNGIANMQRRAKQMGATLTLNSGKSGTRVVLDLATFPQNFV